jgi:hypothetical protein
MTPAISGGAGWQLWDPWLWAPIRLDVRILPHAIIQTRGGRVAQLSADQIRSLPIAVKIPKARVTREVRELPRPVATPYGVNALFRAWLSKRRTEPPMGVLT